MPIIVLEIAFGILVGPPVFKLAQPDGMLAVLGHIGLIFLFFLAGIEMDLRRTQGKPLSLAGPTPIEVASPSIAEVNLERS